MDSGGRMVDSGPMTTLVIATRNAHKAAEIQAMLGEHFRCLTLREFPGAPEVVEDAPTFLGNALKKSVELAIWLAKTRPAALGEGEARTLADDSGLEVDALDGAPGVLSARFASQETGAEGNSPDAANNAKLLRLLEGVPPEERSGRFKCAMALTPVEELSTRALTAKSITAEGACEGVVLAESRGGHGFGYDPLFVPTGFGQTFAELGEEVKNRISHRSHALTRLRKRMAASPSR